MRQEVLAAHLLYPAERHAGADAANKTHERALGVGRQPQYGERAQPHGAAGMACREAMSGLPAVGNGIKQAEERVAASVEINAPRAVHVRVFFQCYDQQRFQCG